MSNDIKIIVSDEIIKEITAAFKIIMQQYKLGNTAVIESLEWQYKNEVFTLIANDYFQWINTGRRPKARKVPIEALIIWIKKKNIIPSKNQSVNSLAYAIQNGIYKNGIKARPFENPALLETLDILTDYLEETLAQQIADEISRIMTFEINITT